MLPKGKLLREHPAPLAVQDVQHTLLTAIWHFRLYRLGTVNSNSGNELHERGRGVNQQAWPASAGLMVV